MHVSATVKINYNWEICNLLHVFYFSCSLNTLLLLLTKQQEFALLNPGCINSHSNKIKCHKKTRWLEFQMQAKPSARLGVPFIQRKFSIPGTFTLPFYFKGKPFHQQGGESQQMLPFFCVMKSW